MAGKGNPATYFKPGNTAAAGHKKKKLPSELERVKDLRPQEFRKMVSRYFRMNREEIKKHFDDMKTPMVDMVIITGIMNAAIKGDFGRLEFLLTRLWGPLDQIHVRFPDDEDEKDTIPIFHVEMNEEGRFKRLKPRQVQ